MHRLTILSFCLTITLGLIHQSSPFTRASGSADIFLWQLDFTKFPDDVRKGLKDSGFQFEKAMKSPKKIDLSGTGERLNITANQSAFGLLVNKDLNVPAAEWVEITWGVDSYPKQADWSNGKNQEAVMVYLFFGESVASDRFYLPDSPFFIGLFLGRNEATLTPYTGKSYKETGRYVCLGNPEPGETLTSRYHFAQAFRDMFGTSEVPPVTGIAIEVDTGSLSEGASSAFIQTIGLQGAES
jgi:hypothetical protein